MTDEPMKKVTGADLINWGYKPGPWFKAAIDRANEAIADGHGEIGARSVLIGFEPIETPKIRRRELGAAKWFINMDGPDEHYEFPAGEAENFHAVQKHMQELMRVPTIKAGAVMPDACPAGSAPGTIPVGGVVAAENAIHPGYHSADICCSMAISVIGHVSPKMVLDVAMAVTHFGPGGRNDGRLEGCGELDHALRPFLGNQFLDTPQMLSAAKNHFGTQGDGNHFFSVGTLKSTGETAIVTHHGSRKPGALLYKAGMRAAEKNMKAIAAGIPKHQSWITADSEDGQDYWAALQAIRGWTKANHYVLHDLVAELAHLKVRERFWNEHNFVFQRTDGLFYHAKGATPAYKNFSDDTNGLTLIPMNMAEPILIARGKDAPHGLGFAPHGAGRNFSRTRFLKDVEALEHEYARAQMRGLPSSIDARWFSGVSDASEMPGAYKSAASVRRQIATYNLADVVDEVLPYGCIMAGHIDWRDAGKRLGDQA